MIIRVLFPKSCAFCIETEIMSPQNRVCKIDLLEGSVRAGASSSLLEKYLLAYF